MGGVNKLGVLKIKENLFKASQCLSSTITNSKIAELDAKGKSTGDELNNLEI